MAVDTEGSFEERYGESPAAQGERSARYRRGAPASEWKTWDAIMNESDGAAERYGAFRSTHEALGVLAEEVAELTEAIRSNSLEQIRAESIQVAAVAYRLASQCSDFAADYFTEFADRSGCEVIE